MPAANPVVLVAESDALTRELIAAALSRLDPRPVVLPAFSGRQALQAAAGRRPDLALVDLLLPHGGIGLIAQLKNAGVSWTLPVIVMSGVGLRSVVRQAARAGADDFLLKPLRPEDLARRVERWLSAGGGADEHA